MDCTYIRNLVEGFSNRFSYNVDPDELSYYDTFQLVLLCLQKYPFTAITALIGHLATLSLR